MSLYPESSLSKFLGGCLVPIIGLGVTTAIIGASPVPEMLGKTLGAIRKNVLVDLVFTHPEILWAIPATLAGLFLISMYAKFQASRNQSEDETHVTTADDDGSTLADRRDRHYGTHGKTHGGKRNELLLANEEKRTREAAEDQKWSEQYQ